MQISYEMLSTCNAHVCQLTVSLQSWNPSLGVCKYFNYSCPSIFSDWSIVSLNLPQIQPSQEPQGPIRSTHFNFTGRLGRYVHLRPPFFSYRCMLIETETDLRGKRTLKVDWSVKILWLGCENSRPSSLSARVVFRVKEVCYKCFRF